MATLTMRVFLAGCEPSRAWLHIDLNQSLHAGDRSQVVVMTVGQGTVFPHVMPRYPTCKPSMMLRVHCAASGVRSMGWTRRGSPYERSRMSR